MPPNAGEGKGYPLGDTAFPAELRTNGKRASSLCSVQWGLRARKAPVSRHPGAGGHEVRGHPGSRVRDQEAPRVGAPALG